MQQCPDLIIGKRQIQIYIAVLSNSAFRRLLKDKGLPVIKQGRQYRAMRPTLDEWMKKR
jgi:excisionase family DNA binding protein